MTVPAATAAGTVTPTEVADNVLRCIADSEAAQPPMRFFAFVDEADVRRQAAESTARRGFRSTSTVTQSHHTRVSTGANLVSNLSQTVLICGCLRAV